MATASVQVQVRLACYARWLLIVATALAKHTPLRFPRGFVLFIVNRSWSMRIGGGPWRSIRVDEQGRVIG